jgi:MYXO-CTERM domain-containing protein
MMRWLSLVLLAGCMTDPNGDTCVWAPGNDGFCPSDSGGSSGPKKIYTNYYSATGVAEGDLVRVAMTRSVTDEKPVIETVVLSGAAPEHRVVTLDGVEMAGSILPRLAAIGDRTYLAWFDEDVNATVGAPLHDSAVVGEEIVHLGPKGGVLRRLGDRFLYVVMADPAEIRGTWIDRDGKLGETIVLATNVATTTSSPFELSDDGASGTIALLYGTLDKATKQRGLVLARIAADGTHRDTTIATFATERDGVKPEMAAIATSDGGAFAIVTFVSENKATLSRVRVDPDGRLDIQPTTLSVRELVRKDTMVLAITTSQSQTLVSTLDEQGTLISGSFPVDVRGVGAAFATPRGFAMVHTMQNTPVAVTVVEGVPLLPITVAEDSVEEVDGCGCRSTNTPTAGLLVLVGALVLRRRRVRRAA